MVRKLILAALPSVAIALAPASPAAAQYFPSDDDLGLMLRYAVEDGTTPGLEVGILEADGSTRIIRYGSAGPDARPLDTRSVFEIGSVSKTFTATVLADMVARGEVALDDPVSMYVPDGAGVPSRGGREITLVDLATHRSGLPRVGFVGPPADPQDPYADFTTEKLYAFLASHELAVDPGARYSYSNLGFQLLADALGRAAGMPYADLVRERVLDPLGMTMTGYELEGARAEWMTQGHRAGQVMPHWYSSVHGAGGLLSNVEEMLQYLKSNVGPPESELERAMRVAHRVFRSTTRGDLSIGMGWHVSEFPDRVIVEHRGDTGGFNSMIAFDPDAGVGFVLLANTAGYDDDIMMPLLVHGPWGPTPDVSQGPDALASFAGAYEFSSGGPLCIRLEGEGHLTGQEFGEVRFPMFAESDSTFILKPGRSRLAFRTTDGEVSGLVLEEPEASRTAQRTEDGCPSPRALATGNISGNVQAALSIGRVTGGQALIAVLSLLALLALLTLGIEARRAFGRRESGE